MGLKRGRTGRNTTLPKIGRRKVKSQFEFDLYKELSGLIRDSGSIEYETEKLEYTETKQYLPDLIVRGRDGNIRFYIEGKGYFPYDERAKMVAVKAQHPDLDIRIVFYRDTPSSLGKGNKMKPTEWATKYGFPSAVKTIPEEWFTE
jgi:hypothetical protein